MQPLSPARTARTRIVLNMIVKNEAPVIRRCLASVRPWIDHWVIVDTGSTDGTQQIVRDFMGNTPGTLHERPWRDFGHNRNEALALARAHGEQVLFIDADETLQTPPDFSWPTLSADGYQLRCEMNGWHYARNALASTRLNWRWEGVLHEYLTCNQPHAWTLLAEPAIHVSHDGARGRNPDTYLGDISVLERAVQDEPANTRYRFYLAQSYRDAGQLQASQTAYRQRAAMGGWDEEVWFSLFQIALLTERLDAPSAEVRDAFLTAYQHRPTRAEPLCALSRHHRLRGEYALAHLFAQQAACMPRPDDRLFVDAEVYAWRALDELVASAYYVNAKAQGKSALQRLLAEQRFPPSERERLQANRVFYGV